MKLTAGLASADDLAAYAEAGADEVFAGFVPQGWQEEYGLFTPLNRREVCYYNVQLGSDDDLMLLLRRAEKYNTAVSLAFNGLHYQPEQLPVIADILSNCADMGARSVIVADPALMVYLKEEGISNRLHIIVSGEFGEMNRYIVRELWELGAQRIIFHRKVPLSAMRSMIQAGPPDMEYEAFLLNEMCHFTGAYCNTLHCDELIPMCRMPYIVSGAEMPDLPEYDPDALGATGCGLCALWKLREARVTHLKIVGRGAHTDNMLRDIRAAKTALDILEDAPDETAFRESMKQELFPRGCGGQCYYRDVN